MFCHNCGLEVPNHYKFCSRCGSKLDTSFLKESNPDSSGNSKRLVSDYNELFKKIENTIKKECVFSDDEFEEKWGSYKKYNYNNYTDKEIYWILVKVIFYSGFRSSTVTSKLPEMKKYLYDYEQVKIYTETDIKNLLTNENIIRNENKIRGCVDNSKIFDDIIKKYGSFSQYLESFGDINQDYTLEKIRSDLKRFKYLGDITSYHLMLDLGLNVWKPDLVIRRILYRLGLIEDRNDIKKSVQVGKEFSKQINLPIRYIDIIMVKYGQLGNEEGFGLPNGGICLEKNPKCSVCGVKDYCHFKST